MTSDDRHGAPDIKRVRILSRGLSVLRAFTPRNRWMSNHEIASATQLPRPTISRLTANLFEHGYLEYSPDEGQYRLGAAVMSLGYPALAQSDVREIARPHLQKLARQEDALVVISTRSGVNMICHEVFFGQNMLTLRVTAGTGLPLATSALGRALVGSLPTSQREAFLAEFAADHPDEWRRLQSGLKDSVQQMQTQNCYISIGTLEDGVNGIAAVLDVPDASHIYAFGLAGPASRFTPELLKTRSMPRLLEVKAAVEHEVSSMTLAA